MCDHRVRDARFHQDRVGYSRIELPGEVAGDTPPKSAAASPTTIGLHPRRR